MIEKIYIKTCALISSIYKKAGFSREKDYSHCLLSMTRYAPVGFEANINANAGSKINFWQLGPRQASPNFN